MKHKYLIFSLLSIVFSATLLTSCGDVVSSKSSMDSSGNWIFWDEQDSSSGGDDIIEGPQYNTIDWSKDYYDYTGSINESGSRRFNPEDGTHRYEPEICATLTGDAVVEEGYFIGYLSNGSSVSFNINASKACRVLLVANLSTNPNKTEGVWFDTQYSVKVNNVDVNSSDCWIQPTFSWSEFLLNPVGTLDLVEGQNTIVFNCYESLSNIDFISLSPLKSDVVVPEYNYSSGMIVEAEDCLLNNCTREANSSTSNGMIIGFNSSSTSVEFIVNSDAERTVDIIAKSLFHVTEYYPSSAKYRFTLTINNQIINVNDTTLINGGEYGDWWLSKYHEITLATAPLKKGQNDIIITLSSEMNLDYIKLM